MAWRQLCAIAAARQAARGAWDATKAKKFALAQYKQLYGDWPRWEIRFEPAATIDPVPTENLIRTVRVTDRADVGPANDGNVRIAAVHSVNVDEWLASFGRSSGRRAACTVFRRRPSMAVVRPRDDGSCGAGRPRAASP